LAQDPRDLLVEAGDARAAVHHEDEQIGLVHRLEHLAAHALHQVGLAARIETAGVHDGGLPALEDHGAVEAVAGDAGHVAHERAPAADEPVEERGLAHVRAAHDGDDRAQHLRRRLPSPYRPRSAARRAGASGSTGVTGAPREAARSAGVRSSRKTPAPSRIATAGTSTSSPRSWPAARACSSWIWMSRPVSSPATPMPRPKNSLATGTRLARSPPTTTRSSSARIRGANISPVTTVTCRGRARRAGRRLTARAKASSKRRTRPMPSSATAKPSYSRAPGSGRPAWRYSSSAAHTKRVPSVSRNSRCQPSTART